MELFHVGLASKVNSPMRAMGILFREPVREYVVAVVVDRNLGGGPFDLLLRIWLESGEEKRRQHGRVSSLVDCY
jgi:hypothetical protein